MLRLKASKTSLYKLVSGYEKLPLMRRTQFVKAPRQRDYWLEWMDSRGLQCRAFLMSGLLKPLLVIEKNEFCGPQVSRVVHTLDIKELTARGMTEEFAPGTERWRAERSADHGTV